MGYYNHMLIFGLMADFFKFKNSNKSYFLQNVTKFVCSNCSQSDFQKQQKYTGILFLILQISNWITLISNDSNSIYL